MNVLDLFLDRIQMFVSEEYCADDKQEVKQCLLDYTGVALAGAKFLQKQHQVYLTKNIYSSGGSVVIGNGKKADVYSAVLLNALSAHVLELDDGHRYGMLHPGTPVISALLPVLENEAVSPECFLMAVAVGYEAAIRLACMIQPEHKQRGFHATATCGTFGAAIAVGYARDYDKDQLRGAASAALTSSSGLLAMIDDDSELKPYNCAQAAVNGLMAANVAYCGYRSPIDALGGKRGFLSSINGNVDMNKIRQTLEMKNCFSTIYRKAYASCRHTHPSVEAALQIRTHNTVDLNRIEKIEVETYDLAVYGHTNTDAKSISAAKMSTPYSVATALLYGLSGPDAFTDVLLEDKDIQELATKVSLRERLDLSALVPSKRAAVVKVFCNDGAVLEERVDYPKGEPENPLTEDELLEKFAALAAYAGKDSEEIKELINSIQNIEDSLPRFWELI